MDNQQVKYQTGEVSLKYIGSKLGNITPTMVNRLFNSAHEKVQSLCQNKPIKLLTQEEDEALEALLQSHRVHAVNEYVKLFNSVNFDIYDFIIQLSKLQYVTDSEIKLITEEEIESMCYLKLLLIENQSEKDCSKEVKEILLTDLDSENNIYKLFQSMVARIAFPDKKRGRPRKEY